MDLYTTEMFDEELFLARRYMVPWRFNNNKTLSSRWGLMYQKVLFEEMLVAMEETTNERNQVIDEPLHSTVSTTDNNTVSTTDNNNISHLSTGVCSAKQLEEFEASVDSTEFKDSSSTQVKESVSSNVSVEETAERNISGQVMLVSEVAKSQQIKSDVEIATLPHSSGSSHSSKIAISGQGSVDKGHHPGINGLKPTVSQKRTNQMTKVYGDGESVSKKFKEKIAEKLNELKIKIEKNNEMNKLILNVRTIK